MMFFTEVEKNNLYYNIFILFSFFVYIEMEIDVN